MTSNGDTRMRTIQLINLKSSCTLASCPFCPWLPTTGANSLLVCGNFARQNVMRKAPQALGSLLQLLLTLPHYTSLLYQTTTTHTRTRATALH